MSVIDSDANPLDLSFSGSYPVKVSSLRDFEVQSRDMIIILSHAEIFSFAFMDSISMVTVQTLGLQQMRREAAIESAPKALLLQRQSFVLLLVPLSYC